MASIIFIQSLCFGLLATGVLSAVLPEQLEKEKDSEFWHSLGKERLENVLKEEHIKTRAKNVIMFLGDGMGASTVTAARILAGQNQGKRGEEVPLTMDTFPYVGLSMVYTLDFQVPDSTATGTAFLGGVKANIYTVGVNGRVKTGDCGTFTEDRKVTSFLRWSADAKKSTGIITTTHLTHGTPASAYAHTPERTWESDRNIPDEQKNCKDIALQLIKNNSDINVLLGGGRAFFLPEGAVDLDADPTFDTSQASRLDGRNLIEEWKSDKVAKNQTHRYVINKEEFDQVDPATTDYLLGIFSSSHMSYEIDRNVTKEPSLAEMTEKAIRILSKNKNGFFLLVEGGRIDAAHHVNQAKRALYDVIAMDDAIKVAMELTSQEETLIVVTADHSHTLSIAGFSFRGNPILGKALTSFMSLDGKPYTTLMYGNGPGYGVPRENVTAVDTTHDDYVQQSAVPLGLAAHSGEDVAIYARGPYSYLYTGVHEQSYIPMVMSYAACVGPMGDTGEHCKTDGNSPNSASWIKSSGLLVIVLIFLPHVETKLTDWLRQDLQVRGIRSIFTI